MYLQCIFHSDSLIHDVLLSRVHAYFARTKYSPTVCELHKKWLPRKPHVSKGKRQHNSVHRFCEEDNPCCPPQTQYLSHEELWRIPSTCGSFSPCSWSYGQEVEGQMGRGWASVLNTYLSRLISSGSSENSRYKYFRVSPRKKLSILSLGPGFTGSRTFPMEV